MIPSVSPKSKKDIETIVNNLRKEKFLDDYNSNIENIITFIEEMHIDVNRCSFDEWETIRSEEEIEAFYDDEFNCINVREDIYDKADQGDPHCRFTLAHELAHHQLKHGKSYFISDKKEGQHYCPTCPEWQANYYAGALLVPIDFACYSYDDVMRLYNVSRPVAEKRYKHVKNIKKR